ncbi:MAG: response regulator [Candidatus Falkowbacteria bacterium]
MKKLLLVVEDEDLMRKILAERFVKENFEVIQADNGEAGLEEALTHKPDFILLDIIMPKLDGMVVMEEIRKAGEWGQKVPIAVLTNLTVDDQTLQKIEASKPSCHMIKTDWSLDQIVVKINKMLSDLAEDKK